MNAATRVLSGLGEQHWAGWSVATGDLDGDGRSDVAAGAPGADRGAGMVLVWLGSELFSRDGFPGRLYGAARETASGTTFRLLISMEMGFPTSSSAHRDATRAPVKTRTTSIREPYTSSKGHRPAHLASHPHRRRCRRAVGTATAVPRTGSALQAAMWMETAPRIALVHRFAPGGASSLP